MSLTWIIFGFFISYVSHYVNKSNGFTCKKLWTKSSTEINGSAFSPQNSYDTKNALNKSNNGSNNCPKILGVVVGSSRHQLHYLSNHTGARFILIPHSSFVLKYVPKLLVDLISQIIEFKPGLLLIYPASPFGGITVVIAKIFRKKHIIFTYGNDLVNRQNKLGKRLVSFALRNSDGVICDYPELMKYVKKIGGKNVVSIPMGIERPISSKIRPKKVENKVVSVINFNHAYSKGIDLLIQAVKNLPTVHLVLVGKGKQRTAMMKLAKKLGISDRVTFTGFIPREELCSHLLEACLYVLPTRAHFGEGTNRSVVEAMSVSLPVVVTRVGGLPSLVVDGVNGFVVSPENVEELSDAISKVLTNKDLQKKMGEINRTKAKDYTVEVLTVKRIEYLSKFS